MIHHHLTTAINVGLDLYLNPANQADWLALLDDTAHDDALLLKIYAEMQNERPEVRPFASAGTAKMPLVITQQLSKRTLHRPLGHTAAGKESSISRQEAKIEIMAANPDFCHILSLTIYKILQGFRSDFLHNGYLSYQLNGLEELSPSEQLAAEELGIYVQRVNLEAMLQDESATIRPDQLIGTLKLGTATPFRI